MFDISLYPLFFLAKSKPQKGRRPSPLHTPGLLGKTSALVLVWGSIFVAWYGAWISRGGNPPQKSTLTQGVPPNPQPIQTKISRPGPPGKFFTILDQKTKFPSNTQPRVCRGTGEVPLRFCNTPLRFHTIFLNHMIFLNRSFRSSTLASFGLPGAQASACADSARNCRSSSLIASSLVGIPTSTESFLTASIAAFLYSS